MAKAGMFWGVHGAQPRLQGGGSWGSMGCSSVATTTSAPQLAPRGISAWCQLCHHVWDTSHWFLQRKAWPHGHKDIDSNSFA